MKKANQVVHAEKTQTQLYLGRRRFLQLSGLGAALVSPIIRDRLAFGANAQPKRVIFIVSGLGHERSAWGAKGTETNFAFNEILQLLNRYKSKMILTKGLDMKFGSNVDPGAHPKQRCILTNAPSQYGGDDNKATAEGPSIDQIIATAWAGLTKFRSLELGYGGGGRSVFLSPCYSGPKTRVELEVDPRAAFNRLFAGVNPSGTPTIDPIDVKRAGIKKSVLDAVVSDLSSLQKELSGGEKAKLDAHLTGIRSLEAQLASAQIGPRGGCFLPPSFDKLQDALFGQNFKAHVDLVASAIACDLTRVFALQWGQEGQNQSHPDFKGSMNNQNIDPHLASHKEANYTVEDFIRVSKIKATNVLALCDALSAIQEGAGTALDNTVIVWTSGNADGSHAGDDLPFVIIGNSGGYFKSGRYVTYTKQNHAHALLNVAEAVGVTVSSFGNHPETRVTLPFDNLKA